MSADATDARSIDARSMYTRLMNIGEAAQASGISAKMIRHYEQIGLMPKVARTFSGYRLYNQNDLHLLCFIRHARDLGFSTVQIGKLLELWHNQQRPSSEVKAMVSEHVRTLKQKIAELEAMQAELQRLVDGCHGDQRPDCPILDRLAN